MRSRIGKTLVVLALTTGVVLLGVVGVSLAVSGHGTSAGSSSGAPIGELSAGSSPGSGSGKGDSGGTKGETKSGGKGAGSKGDSGAGSTPSSVQTAGGSGTGKLPFTGFLAIPVLLVGLALLGAGIALRRRDTAPSRP